MNRITPRFIVRIAGGLGNQLFQYCFARSLALTKEVQVFLDINYFLNSARKYLLPEFNTIQNIVDPAELRELLLWRNRILFRMINKLLPALQKKYYREQVGSTGIDEKIKQLRGVKYLDGYWQNKAYFQSVWGQLQGELQLKQKSATCAALQKKIETCTSVSIHIRRGDYVANARIIKEHGFCSQEYYDQAIRAIVQKTDNPVFFIFSDDIAWAQQNFMIHYPHEFISSLHGLSECEELFLMSKCKHNIVANSTYSWWGAWMNEYSEKIVIAPRRWSNTPSARFENIVPDEWVKI